MTTGGYPPGPKFWFPGWGYLVMHRDPLGAFTEMTRSYGDIIHLHLGRRHDYLLNHPDYIKEVLLAGDDMARSTPKPIKPVLGKGLLTSQGEFHRCQRRLLQPAFRQERIMETTGVIVEYAARATECWQEGETLDIAPEMMRLTMNVVVKALFDSDLEGRAHDLGELFTTILENTSLKPPFAEALLSWLRLSGYRRQRETLARLDTVLHGMIEERRRGGAFEGRDFLSMLLALQQSMETGSGMTDQQVRDEVMTIFSAGHETTGNALAWTWYSLSQNPEVEAKLYAEIRAVLGERRPTFEDLPALSYTRMVFSEVLRLYPPVWIMGRRPLRDFEIGGYVIPKLSHVYVSQWSMHRDPRYFPAPEKFDPERWLPEVAAARPKFSYFPFGAGDRQCIGEGFAWMEAMLIVVTIAQRWQMKLAPNHRVEMEPLLTLRPKYGMRMTLHKR